jgi:hypothetical protein
MGVKDESEDSGRRRFEEVPPDPAWTILVADFAGGLLGYAAMQDRGLHLRGDEHRTWRIHEMKEEIRHPLFGRAASVSRSAPCRSPTIRRQQFDPRFWLHLGSSGLLPGARIRQPAGGPEPEKPSRAGSRVDHRVSGLPTPDGLGAS